MFAFPLFMLGLMVYLIVMMKRNKTNRFVEWWIKKSIKKTSPKELIFMNFWVFGIILFLLGVGSWYLLWSTPEIHLFSISGFFLLSVSLFGILAGEMRIFLYYDKYFVQKNFDGPDPAVDEYSKHIDMKMKIKEFKSELINSHRPPWYKDTELWMYVIGLFLIVTIFVVTIF